MEVSGAVSVQCCSWVEEVYKVGGFGAVLALQSGGQVWKD